MMRLLIRILSLLFLFFLLRYILRSILIPPKVKPDDTSQGEQPGSSPRMMHQGRMEKDPICGTYVDIASSLSLTKGEEIRYFCSEECRKKFQQTGSAAQ
jgi:YHS domain-containing protein